MSEGVRKRNVINSHSIEVREFRHFAFELQNLRMMPRDSTSEPQQLGFQITQFASAKRQRVSLAIAETSLLCASCFQDSRLAAVQDNYSQLMNYLRSNLHRMDYPVYIRNGWQIGSAKVESSCKSIVGTRLKGPGIRWRPFGTTALSQMRALFKSETKL